MQKLVFLEDSYKKTHSTKVIAITATKKIVRMVVESTIFYPQGGGQPSDQGTIIGKSGQISVSHVHMEHGEAIHEGVLTGTLKKGDTVELTIDWNYRFENMRRHSAGHVVHEVVMKLVPGLNPIRGEHGKTAFIEYQGFINPKLAQTIEKQANMVIAEGRKIKTKFVSLEQLQKEASWLPPHLPSGKPLRIIQIEGFPPIPDGGTQVNSTSEVGTLTITQIENEKSSVKIYYSIGALPKLEDQTTVSVSQRTPQEIPSALSLGLFQTLLLDMETELTESIKSTSQAEKVALKLAYFGSSGKATQLIRRLKDLPQMDRKSAGQLVNTFKSSAMDLLQNTTSSAKAEWFDVSLPGVIPPIGHLHIVSQAIMEITHIFEKLGFTRVRYPEVDWDWYPFGSLNMPAQHPARDEWETFFIDYPGKPGSDPKKQKMVLTPHTSNGQVREMEKGSLPIRMINIAKCYRRQIDVSHTPMFHQFEGLYIDKNVSIGHLKGVVDYFFKQFYGKNRKARLRPFHFQFTEPSFEIDVSCGICDGTGILTQTEKCRLCKEGWLELGGAGMVHPVVLQNGGIDPEKYSGFAFGWGVERTYMMKSGTSLDDIRLLYGNDIRFLEQF